MANLKDYTAQELTDEWIRRLEEKKNQIKSNIEDLTDVRRGFDLAKKICDPLKPPSP
jgi:prefoldin subunit 5